VRQLNGCAPKNIYDRFSADGAGRLIHAREPNYHFDGLLRQSTAAVGFNFAWLLLTLAGKNVLMAAHEQA